MRGSSAQAGELHRPKCLINALDWLLQAQRNRRNSDVRPYGPASAARIAIWRVGSVTVPRAIRHRAPGVRCDTATLLTNRCSLVAFQHPPAAMLDRNYDPCVSANDRNTCGFGQWIRSSPPTVDEENGDESECGRTALGDTIARGFRLVVSTDSTVSRLDPRPSTPWPAKFIPDIPATAIKVLTSPGDLVLDPVLRLWNNNGRGSTEGKPFSRRY